ncbi:DUF3768 domain-containing protein [Microbaculum sp. FT89]|uniref:DUF3768 domain-containing protein n=1 Tax=Microbaculum sp. FT89 TaxID=3447298 RepID=UPI003F531752
MEHDEQRSARIARLNDALRATFAGGNVVITNGVAALPPDTLDRLYMAVRGDTPSPENDPYGERDFGAVTVKGERYFWKIDYYDQNLEYHSEDAADPHKTRRVLTILRADEY